MSKYFDIDPDSIKKCKLSQNCQSNSAAGLSTGSKLEHGWALRQTMLQRAQEMAADKTVTVSEPADLNATSLPSIALDFTADEESTLLIDQGGMAQPDQSICCDADASACQVEMETSKITKYQDGTNSRIRVDDARGNIVIDVFGSVMKVLVWTSACHG